MIVYALGGLVVACVVLAALWRLSVASERSAEARRVLAEQNAASETARADQADVAARAAELKAKQIVAAVAKFAAASAEASADKIAAERDAGGIAAILGTADPGQGSAAARMNKARGRDE